MAKIFILEVDGCGASMTPSHPLDQVIISSQVDALGRTYKRASLNPTGAIQLTQTNQKKGLECYVEGITNGSTVLIEDGYYTIDPNSSMSDIASTILYIIVDDSCVPGTYTLGVDLDATALMRIETFYKWASGVPDMLTRSDLYDYGPRAKYEPLGWYAPIVADVSDTIGQEIKVNGGMASADGFNIDMVVPTQNGSTPTRVQWFHTTYQTTGSNNPNYSLDSIITSDSDVSFANHYLMPLIQSKAPSYFGATIQTDGVYAGDDNLFITPYAGAFVSNPSPRRIYPVNNNLNDEAVLVTQTVHQTFTDDSDGSTLEFERLYVTRAVLNTVQAVQPKGSLLYNNHKAIGSICRVYRIDSNCRGRIDWELIYRGTVDNISFGNNNASISVSISNPIAEISRNRIASRFTAKIDTPKMIPRENSGLEQNQVGPYDAFYTDDYNITAFQVGVSQPNTYDRWRWMRVGKCALRLQSDQSPIYQSILAAYEASEIDSPDYEIIFKQIKSSAEFDIAEQIRITDVNPKPYNFQYSVPRWRSMQLNNIDTLADLDYEVSPNIVVLDKFDYASEVDSSGISQDERNYFSRKREQGNSDTGEAAGGITSGKYFEPSYSIRMLDGAITDGIDYRINRYAPGKQPDLFGDAELIHLFENEEPLFVSYTNDISAQSLVSYLNDKLNNEGNAMPCHALEVILQMLMSTGKGTNTLTYAGITYNFDVLPSELGLGLSQEFIDFPSFLNLRNQEYINFPYDFGRFGVLNLSIRQSESEDLVKWLEDNLLQPFYLSLVQTKTGAVRVARTCGNEDWFNFSNISELGVSTLDLTYLAKQTGDNFSVNLNISTENLYNSVAYRIQAPGVPASTLDAWPSATIAYNTSIGNAPQLLDGNTLVSIPNPETSFQFGLVDIWNRVSQRVLNFKPTWYPLFEGLTASGDELEFATTITSGIFLKLYNRPTYEITLTYRESLITTVDIGDFCILDNLNAPDIFGRFSKDENSYLAYVKNRTYDLKRGLTTLTMIYFDLSIFFTSVLRRVGASAKVDGVTSDTVFSISTPDYSKNDADLLGRGVLKYGTDYGAFLLNDSIVLLNPDFSIKGQALGDVDAYSARVISSIVTDTVTLSTAFDDSTGSNVSPAVGDIIIHADLASQTETQTIYDWVYTYVTTTVNYGG